MAIGAADQQRPRLLRDHVDGGPCPVRRNGNRADRMAKLDGTVRVQREARRDARAAERIVADRGGVAVKRPAARVFDAQNGLVTPVPRGIVATAIAEPQERDRKDLRILQDEEEIPLALAGGCRPAEAAP